MRSTRTRRRGTALAALGLALAAGVAGLGPSGAGASSHREAPLIAADPAVDNTDVYAFASPDRPGYATFVANFIPFEEPNGGPNFYPFATDAVYNINIDNNGDARPDVVIDLTCYTPESTVHLVESLRGRVGHFLHCGTIWVHGPAVGSADDRRIAAATLWRLRLP